MSTPHLDAEIRALIDQFTGKFRELLGLAALGSVQMALEAGVGTPVAPARRGPGRPRGSGKAKRGRPAGSGQARPEAAKSAPGRRTRLSPEDLEEVAEQVLGYVRAHPGSRLEEIGRGSGRRRPGSSSRSRSCWRPGGSGPKGRSGAPSTSRGGGSGG